MSTKKLNLQIEKQQAVAKKRFNRRVKQFLMLALVSFPFLLWLGMAFTKANLNNFLTVVIYSAILLALWGCILGSDILISKRAKKLRQIKNAKAIVDIYNKQVLEKRKGQEKIEKEINDENISNEQFVTNETIKSEMPEIVEQIESEKNVVNNTSANDLQNKQKSVIISDIEKKQKIKQKKYGNFNNKRKK